MIHKCAWTSTCHTAFITPKSTLLEAPNLHCRDPSKCYKVYKDASDDACGVQLSQECNGQELPVVFLSHTFAVTQWKWSTTEQEACGIYYAVTKWNYYLQGPTLLYAMTTKLYRNF